MSRELLIACLPYIAAIGASLLALRGLVWLSGAKWRLGQLACLHRDQQGSVQSLSFVLTLPVFMLIMMFILQLSQIVIAKMVVQYSAFAAARSAIVWIPANLGPGQEQENQISSYAFLGEVRDENGVLFQAYEVAPGSFKHNKIQLAAAMAVMPLAPSRRAAVGGAHPGNAALPSIAKAYRGVSPASMRNTRIPARLANKLAYSLENTNVRIEIRHKDSEPPLANHSRQPYLDEFAFNEIGWQDQVIVTVSHQFALLPGPARLIAGSMGGSGSSPSPGLSAPVNSPGSLATSAQTYGVYSPPAGNSRPAFGGGQIFFKEITAIVRLNNEGEKPLLPYVQRLDGAAAAVMRTEDLPVTQPPGTSPGETGM